MKFTTPFIVASLPFMVLSSPIEKLISIPIRKRGPATTRDGVVDMTVVRNHLAHVTAKYGAGLKKDTDSVHPAARNGVTHTSKRGDGTVALTDDRNLLCASSTSVNTQNTFNLSYGDQSSSSGQIYTDVVTVAGLTAQGQALGSATVYTQFQNRTPDGIIGMAWPNASYFNNTGTPFFTTLVQQKALSQNLFAFYLSAYLSGVGSLHLGGLDPSIYHDPITYTPVTRQHWWQVGLDSVNVNGAAVGSNLSAVVDSGTTYILGDPDTVEKLYNAIGGAPLENSNGMYTYPCHTVPQVSFTFSGASYSISSFFGLGHITNGSTNCLGAIMSSPTLTNSFWILGDSFLRNVYAVFDVGNSRVGFAKPNDIVSTEK
ncbi:aspartic peptidase domain-containing protein [Cantharellus anzutake]|uniref:aspartic peptidase domain-containing protein n=1 Tax=Cantharellus anzutake TaxID=1750568 RepID=UPI001903173B|nr:aspartic peptidase domain-containing protein [Cantharellus anzutake]KAF8338740.1 aspartic peptidase domain-containing protein [Cantharellus anzutake]